MEDERREGDGNGSEERIGGRKDEASRQSINFKILN